MRDLRTNVGIVNYSVDEHDRLGIQCEISIAQPRLTVRVEEVDPSESCFDVHSCKSSQSTTNAVASDINSRISVFAENELDLSLDQGRHFKVNVVQLAIDCAPIAFCVRHFR